MQSLVRKIVVKMCEQNFALVKHKQILKKDEDENVLKKFEKKSSSQFEKQLLKCANKISY